MEHIIIIASEICSSHKVYPATVIVAFESAIYTVSEDAGSVTVCAVIRGETAGEEIHLSLLTQDNTAKGTPKSNFQNVAELRLTPMSHIFADLSLCLLSSSSSSVVSE